MNSVRRSFFLNLLDNNLGVLLQLVSGIVLARLLSPQEVGVYAVAAVIIAMAGQLRDFGLGEYLIQESALDDQKIRAAFMVNIVSSWTMAIVVFASSWWVGEFYREPGVAQVLRLQAVNFLIVPFGAVTMAYFRRELQFRPIFIANQVANLTAFAVGLTCAFLGQSYMSMAWSSLAGLVVTVGIAMYFRPKHLPRWPGIHGMRQVLTFSKHAMSIYFINQIGKGAPEAIIGRVLNVAATAFYSRANGLMELFNRVVLRTTVNICLPHFAREARSGVGADKAYLQAVALLTGAGWPFMAVLGLIAFSVIRLLFGDQWDASVPLAQILAVVAIIDLPYWLAAEVMIAVGRVDQSSRLQFIIQTLRIAGLAVGVRFGIAGACWGLVVATAIGAMVSQRYLSRTISLRFGSVARACAPSGLVTLAVSAPIVLITQLWVQREGNYLFVVLAVAPLAALSWLLALRASGHQLWREIVLVASRVIKRAR